jgi:hypothetical protein
VSSQTVTVVIPWPNSTSVLALITIDPASVVPIEVTKITAARPSPVLRLRKVLFFFITELSSALGFNFSCNHSFAI